MSDQITNNTLDTVRSAYDFGPFLFAILFITPLTALALRYYLKEQNPDRINTLKIYFYSSFIFGLLLVTTSVTWWIYDRVSSKSYVYTVRIDGFDKDSVALMSSEAYYQELMINDRQPEANFVFIKRRPIPKGQAMEIDAYPPSGVGAGPDITRLNAPINGYDNKFLYSANGKLIPN